MNATFPQAKTSWHGRSASYDLTKADKADGGENIEKLSLKDRIKACRSCTDLPATLIAAGLVVGTVGLAAAGAGAFTMGASVIPGIILMGAGALLAGAGVVVQAVQNHRSKAAGAEEAPTKPAQPKLDAMKSTEKTEKPSRISRIKGKVNSLGQKIGLKSSK